MHRIVFLARCDRFHVRMIDSMGVGGGVEGSLPRPASLATSPFSSSFPSTHHHLQQMAVCNINNHRATLSGGVESLKPPRFTHL